MPNYCTFNSLDNPGFTLSNGNLTSVNVVGDTLLPTTFAVNSGKWYWEGITNNTITIGGLGVIEITAPRTGVNSYLFATNWLLDAATGNKIHTTPIAYGTAATNGDVMMVALDMDAGKIWWGRNGTWFAGGDPDAGTGEAFTGLTGYLSPMTNWDFTMNFGQSNYAFSPPSGFLSINTQNLPIPEIEDPRDFFVPVKYEGTGADQNIVNMAFGPDLTWIKNRDSSTSHNVTDKIRGATLQLFTDSSQVETGLADRIQTFNPDGFTIGDAGAVNGSGNDLISWNWREGVTPGFEIVNYTGNGTAKSIAHPLGKTPKFMIIKSRNAVRNWAVFHSDLGNSQVLELDTDDPAVGDNVWSTGPTSIDFKVSVAGPNDTTNGSGIDYVAYVWSEVDGFSKFGSYTGNASTDGPFVYCGFRPSYLMLKRADNIGGPWFIYDSVRDSTNVLDTILNAETTGIENVSVDNNIDFLANGFKIRTAEPSINSTEFVFMAFAESPFKTALAFGPGKQSIEQPIPPVWQTSNASPLATVNVGDFVNVNVLAIDPDNSPAPITYSVVIGVLPTGLNLNATTGNISGTVTVVTSSPFTLRAFDGAVFSDREFQIVVEIEPTLIQAITTAGLTGNLQYALDAGDAASYSGAGQSWLDTSGNGQDFFRGLNGSPGALDPTFNGTPGIVSSSEFWSFDDDMFTYDSALTPMMTGAHLAGANFTLMMVIRFGSVSESNVMTGSREPDPGIIWGVRSTAKNHFVIRKTGVTVLNIESDDLVLANTIYFFALSVNEAGSTGFLYRDGAFSQVSASNTFNASYPSPGGSAGHWGISRSDAHSEMSTGSRIYMTAAWDTALSKVQLDGLFNEVKNRFGL